MLSYAINVALLAALLACGGYMVVVGRRLKALRSGQDQIGPIVEHFARLTTEMSSNLESLKGEAGKAAVALEEAIGRAQKKQDEIEMSLMSAEVEWKMAARARASAPVLPVSGPAVPPERPERSASPAEGSRDVIDLKAETRKAEPVEPIGKPQWVRVKPALVNGDGVVESAARPVNARDHAISQAIAAFYGPERMKAGG